MHSGTETYGLVTLVLALVTALGMVSDLKWVSESSFRVSVGTVAVVTSVTFCVGKYGIIGMFIADVGVYVTLLGGVVLLLAERRSNDGRTAP
ncbi:hypothetical protein [Halomicrobium mukohataei]|nr:hypothetical protein [Halomicrobium mukohataei]